jgi:hypothetical protein
MRLLKTLLALLALTSAVSFMGAGTATARPVAKQIRMVNLNTSELRVRTSTGQRLFLSLNANYDSQFGGGTDVSVQLTGRNGESHSWDRYDASHTEFVFTQSGGGHLVVTSKTLGHYGALSLSITARGKPKTLLRCSATSASITQQVTLKGTVVVRTHSKVWGAVGRKRSTLTFKGSSNIETDTGRASSACITGGTAFGKASCDGQLNWQTPGSTHGVIVGSAPKNGKYGTIGFFTSRTVDSRHGIQLETNDFVPVHPLSATLTTNSGTTQVAVSGAGTHGLFTGTATLSSSDAPSINKKVCNGKTREWEDATFTQGANPLTVHDVIGGDFTPKSAAGAEFFQEPNS